MPFLKTAKLSAIAVAVVLSGCSFKEDRNDIVVPIIDAQPAQSSKLQFPQETQQKTKTVPTYSYTVRSGDTLGIIAQKYLGSSQRYTEILALNELKSSDAIYVGQKLQLPTKGLKQPDELQSSNSNKKSSDIEPNKTYPELNELVDSQQYNQAIQWILNQPELSNNVELQEQLVELALTQSKIYKRQQQVADAETLLSGLISEAPLTQNNQKALISELSTLKAEQELITAKRFADQSKFDESYDILLVAWQQVGQPLENNILFTTTRNKVSEHYHQKALRHYRSQELESALVYWKKILAVNPNDDLALVYQDRVKALQNKLENL
ncbi:LysM peptidoglycan-binding domain-containing protein [Kangiella taiwanensis]|uniref:LysM domain-containing protein n=1 Tax=Kangiella taiwanensis TaxID=1079179 RepID=A0ABP8HSK2_9GAMM|nr:LysM domain-containing protein [Kangiella taiwanensis]